MWNKSSLPLKITLPLVLMQILGLICGGWILMSKIDAARLNELDELLIGQTELITESLIHNAEQPDFLERSEFFKEFEKDPSLYFEIVRPDGSILYTSSGPDPAFREELGRFFQGPNVALNKPYDVDINDQTWRTVYTLIRFPNSQKAETLTLKTAMDETVSIDELDSIRTLIIVGGGLLSILTTIATAAIVLLSTVNLRLFAKNLRLIDPENPKWSFPVRAHSAEEILLFTSFDTMMQEMLKARQIQKLFLANASHELKTPVAGMLAALEVVLARERSPESYQAICRDLLRTVRDMKRLTGALLDTSLLDGHKNMALQTIDFRSVVQRVVDRWSNHAAEKSITLEWTPPPLPLWLAAHPELLDVAVSNLVDNAIKYSSSGKSVGIELKSSSDGKTLALIIKDQGMGMDAATQARLGEIFYRADVARSHRDSFGLGFANAKRILESHKAKIKVESAIGMGTRVTIELSQVHPALT
ncbi:MAG: HAMP domain-containing histidine kinase [Proteobacteria bacterium]|nr:MAG: HAMP domain-containing histidine kinase [Pseudomonadota bacterium]